MRVSHQALCCCLQQVKEIFDPTLSDDAISQYIVTLVSQRRSCTLFCVSECFRAEFLSSYTASSTTSLLGASYLLPISAMPIVQASKGQDRKKLTTNLQSILVREVDHCSYIGMTMQSPS